MMNELGETSAAAHKQLGQLCDPKKLDLVVTLGRDANDYLAPAAKQQGCKVVVSDSPYEAGRLIAQAIRPGACVLVKGSQNGVFAEEAIKSLLADASEAKKLVRQSDAWLRKKQKLL
jgi:UDP-N-acetylmuramoyl-tripeptide--D-alanyl-D-alanine ligase